ncbi:hypothetical protein U6A24_20830 [Aquimarina gracilis]|uniref:Uncharacterized protein n=1 Tax=Aquimarina gracilis TaxID=874422 RepID=A0ABU6A1B7_9FLAO|nr:hypothetical protein [Aquimarina gracilis]MEB3347933.1 hypothetical protein [Aquimarina gracilis]
MNLSRIKKTLSLLSIFMGGALLIIEISSEEKNYYLQTIGLVMLMVGLFMVNSRVKSKTEITSQEYFEEE